MKKIYLLLPVFLAFIIFSSVLVSCSEEGYVPASPVLYDYTAVPFNKLSSYKFFKGRLRDQKPGHRVLPYKPASELFSDYAKKLRFVWMPPGRKATYNGDGNVLEFPVGSVLLKTFYFNNVQPGNTTKIIETRLLIKIGAATSTSSGWETYNYIWNEDMTEAYLDTDGNGIFIPVSFLENGEPKDIYYKVPAFTECKTCHKLNPTETPDGEITIPIGPKPQNLNYVYNYGTSQTNQLQKWIEVGYLEEGLPANIYSTVNYKDTSQPLELRARSYIDMNCAHCHSDGGHCDYVNMKFNFSNTDMNEFGVCMTPLFNLPDMPFVINAGDSEHSEVIARMSSNDQSVMMPIIGRTIVHEEGVQLMSDWINSLTEHCE